MCAIDFKLLLTSVPSALSFLIPDTQKTALVLNALYSELPEKEKAYLSSSLCSSSLQSVLKNCYISIDPEGYSADFENAPINPVGTTPDVASFVDEMEILLRRYPLYLGTGRPLHSSEDNEFMPSFETIFRSIGFVFADCIEGIAGTDLLRRTYERVARDCGFESLYDAESIKDAEEFDLDFTDSPCGGEC